ncbi:MAG: hypothetical protein ACLP1Y_12600 [Candidatus Acidiferrales bacterium]
MHHLYIVVASTKAGRTCAQPHTQRPPRSQGVGHLAEWPMPYKDPQRRKEANNASHRRRYRAAQDHPPKDPPDIQQAAKNGTVSTLSEAELRHPRFLVTDGRGHKSIERL